MSDLLLLLVIMLAFSSLGVVSWAAWYALVRYRQRVRHATELELAQRRGLPPPDPPPVPNLLHVIVRVNRVAGLLGLAGALTAVLIFTFGTCNQR